MQIEPIIVSDMLPKPITLGINIEKRFGSIHCNMFALKENDGPAISDNLWKTTQLVVDSVLPSMKVTDIQWTLTVGKRTTAVQFELLNGKPFKIDASDGHVFELEEFYQEPCGRNDAFSLNRYRAEFAGQSSVPVKGRGLELTKPEEPVSVFTIPCAHPAAKDGLFHCIPAYYDASHMRGGYEFLLLDTKKMVAHLKRHDPGALVDAADNFSGAKRWLEDISLSQPRDTGSWNLTNDRQGFTMVTGQTPLIQLVQDIDIPFFPVAVQKTVGPEKIAQFQSSIGYLGSDRQLPGLMRPKFSAAQAYRK